MMVIYLHETFRQLVWFEGDDDGHPGLQPFIHISAPWVEHLDECPRSENALAGAHNAMRELVNSGARCTHIRPFLVAEPHDVRIDISTTRRDMEDWGGGVMFA